MRIPIAHCLAWPERLSTRSPRLDLATMANLTFEPPDEARFPALRLARAALREGGGAPAVLNAANEVAVAAFLDRRIGFLDIATVVETTLQTMGARGCQTLDEVFALDREARQVADDTARSRPSAGAAPPRLALGIG
jgi:1-deoxy-D-xylulose-5-phosphate reductoisomerase